MNRGITAGFRYPLDSALLAQLKKFGWQVVRQDGQHADSTTLLNLYRNIADANLTPFMLCTVSQLQDLPDGAYVEVLDVVDPTTTGLEPSFRVDPHKYADTLNRSAAAVRAKHLNAYACLTGVDPSALNWTKTVLLTLDPVYKISVHRYPPANAMDWLASKIGGRERELANLKAAIGTRAFGVGEFGYHQGPVKSFLDYLLFRHHHWTDIEQAQSIYSELQYWETAGADFACVYQLNDGADRCSKHPRYPKDFRGGFGIRVPLNNPNGPEGRWKLSADAAHPKTAEILDTPQANTKPIVT